MRHHRRLGERLLDAVRWVRRRMEPVWLEDKPVEPVKKSRKAKVKRVNKKK